MNFPGRDCPVSNGFAVPVSGNCEMVRDREISGMLDCTVLYSSTYRQLVSQTTAVVTDSVLGWKKHDDVP